jgi:hypothetical protein
VDSGDGVEGASIVVRDGHVYWTTNGGNVSGVMSAPIDGGPVTNVVPAQDAYAISVDAKYVYWTAYRDGTINRVTTVGDDSLVLAEKQSTPVAVCSDGANVYWANQGGTIRRVPISGGKVLTLAAGQAGPAALALDDTSVYFVNVDDGSVMRVAK